MGFAKVIFIFAKRHFPDERNLDQPPYIYNIIIEHINMYIYIYISVCVCVSCCYCHLFASVSLVFLATTNYVAEPSLRRSGK